MTVPLFPFLPPEIDPNDNSLLAPRSAKNRNPHNGKIHLDQQCIY